MRSPFAAVLLLASTLACGGGGSAPVQAQYQPQIVNKPDNFSLQLTGVTDGSGTLIYGWSNSGAAASINRACAITAGTVALTVTDSAGATVFTGALEGANGTTSTRAGVAGTWTIRVDFAHATGTINFSAQKL